MNITYHCAEGTFLLRAGAIVIQDGCLLTLQRDDHYAIPGGRVTLHEDMETAVLREVREELGVEGRIVRPLWLSQCFYYSEFRNAQVHEVCTYFLVDVDRKGLSGQDAGFVLYEGEKCHQFRWIPLADVSKIRLYPRFLRKGILNLPQSLTLMMER